MTRWSINFGRRGGFPGCHQNQPVVISIAWTLILCKPPHPGHDDPTPPCRHASIPHSKFFLCQRPPRPICSKVQHLRRKSVGREQATKPASLLTEGLLSCHRVRLNFRQFRELLRPEYHATAAAVLPRPVSTRAASSPPTRPDFVGVYAWREALVGGCLGKEVPAPGGQG